MWVTRYFSSSVGKKSLMAVTGCGLALFLMVHLAGNATAFWGRAAFDKYAARLHSFGVIVHVFEVVLLAFFLTHITTGIILYVENLRARPQRYAISKKEGRSLATRLMPYTGLLILVFLVIHLSNFRFSETTLPVAEAVRLLLHRPGFALFYMVALVGVGFHICHGLWSLLQSLGINHPKYNLFFEKGAVTVAVVVAALFFMIPLLALLSNGFLK